MFIDASALVAMIAGEDDAELLHQKLKSHRRRSISALAEFETVLALARLRKTPASDALELVSQFKRIYAVKDVAIDSRISALAVGAFETYGRGRGHKAQLNMGDCFAYACARELDAPLLCKGNDFHHTDIKIA